jgi:RNA-directed DNA polymerase
MYHATRRGDVRTVRRLQRLLRPSWSAKLLAGRRVAQDNGGQRTAGVDGGKSFPPSKRVALAPALTLDGRASPVRRVWRPTAGSTTEHRPLGMPTMAARARQTLGKFALEPAWEARLEANSDGVRPGRSCHEAITALVTALGQKATDGVDADSDKGYDHIDQAALLAQVTASPALRRQLRAGLQAGGLDQGPLFPTEAGTRQGRPWSPWLATMALHGVETAITQAFPGTGSRNRPPPTVVVYADDLVLRHKERAIVERGQDLVSEWLRPRGLALKPRKTRITHTLEPLDGTPGFDVLSFHLRPSPVGKPKAGRNGRGRWQGCKTIIPPSRTALRHQRTTWRQTITRPNHAVQRRLIAALNSRMRGWSNSYRPVSSAQGCSSLENTLDMHLRAGALRRPPKQSTHGSMGKSWRVDERQGWRFQPPTGGRALTDHAKPPMQYHGKVKGTRSP